MTIRYPCKKCESVLKIRDEMAGTKAKCPKCKTPFVVPAVAVLAGQKGGEPEESLVDLVDMPLEVTPPVQYDTADGFDPLDVLAGSTPSMTAVASAPEDAAPKPSVAELMREHEASLANKKKRRDKKSKSGGMEEAAGAAALMTSGTASDALTRNYDQKRGNASDPTPLTRDERRDLEQKEALKEFAVKGGAALAALAVCIYFLMGWLYSASLPDLSYVSGVVTLDGRPLADVEVTFSRTKAPEGVDIEADGSTPSSGFTNSQGEFRLMFDSDNEGVLPGTHQVYLVSTGGITYVLPSHLQEAVVPVDDSVTIDFKF